SFTRGIRSFTLESGLPDLGVWDLLESRDGCMWMAGGTAGLFEYCRSGWKDKINVENGLPGNRVRALRITSDGSLWVGTSEGLARIVDGKVLQSWKQGKELPYDPYITDIVQGPDGAIWLATRIGGLVRYASGNWQAWSTPEGIPNPNIRGLPWIEQAN